MTILSTESYSITYDRILITALCNPLTLYTPVKHSFTRINILNICISAILLNLQRNHVLTLMANTINCHIPFFIHSCTQFLVLNLQELSYVAQHVFSNLHTHLMANRLHQMGSSNDSNHLFKSYIQNWLLDTWLIGSALDLDLQGRLAYRLKFRRSNIQRCSRPAKGWYTLQRAPSVFPWSRNGLCYNHLTVTIDCIMTLK